MGRLHRSRASQLDTKRRKFSKQAKDLTRNKNLSFSVRCVHHPHSKGLAPSCNVTANKATLAWEAFSSEDDQGQGSLTREVSRLLSFRPPWNDSSTLYPFTSLLTWLALPGLQGVGGGGGSKPRLQPSPRCMWVSVHAYPTAYGKFYLWLRCLKLKMPTAYSVLWQPSHDPKLLVIWGSPPNPFFFPTIPSTRLPTSDIHPIPHHLLLLPLLPVGPLHPSPGWSPGPPSSLFAVFSPLMQSLGCSQRRLVETLPRSHFFT